MKRKALPVGGKVRSKGQEMRSRVEFEAKHAAEQRADDHGGGPDLMRRTGRERLVVIAGKNLGDMAGRAVKGEESVGPKVVVGALRLVVAIFGNRSPAGEERPDRTVVVPTTAILRCAIGNNAHAPVRVMFVRGEQGDHLLRPVFR